MQSLTFITFVVFKQIATLNTFCHSGHSNGQINIFHTSQKFAYEVTCVRLKYVMEGNISNAYANMQMVASEDY